VIFWIDAQLPPGLAPWLTKTFGVEAKSLRFLGLQYAEDPEIYNCARAAGEVVLISKDSDFVELVAQQGPPPRLLWVTCGNLTNRRLRAVFTRVFADARASLEAGEVIVELGDASNNLPQESPQKSHSEPQ
jgi:predicted nuclease of predicted toxin-antitoxin system